MSGTEQLLQQLLGEFSKLTTEMKEMREELNTVKEKSAVTTSDTSITSSSTNPGIVELREVKIEKMVIPEEIIRRCIKYGSSRGDMLLIKHWYLDKSKRQPFRCINRNRWEYWCNGTWNIDIDGEYLKEVIAKNIQNCYLRINRIDYYDDNFDMFLENQKHIHELSDSKYRKRMLAGIKELLKADIMPIL